MRIAFIFTVVVACLAVTVPSALIAEESHTSDLDDPATSGLVEGFVKQARTLATGAGTSGTDAALARLRDGIEAKRKDWEIRIERDLGDERLLMGIPDAVRTKTAKTADDAGKSMAELKAGVSLPQLLAIAAQRNPEMRVAFESLRAAARRFEQAAYLEELIAQYRSFVRELDTKVGPQSHKEMFEKIFAFPSALALKGQIIDLEVELARLRYLEAVRKAVNDTARGFFEVQFAERRIAILKENRDLFGKMDAIANEQLKVGRVSQADSLKAQSELAMIETQVITAERERIKSIARANALLGLSPSVEWGALSPADLTDSALSLDAVLSVSKTENQTLLHAERDVDLMETMVRMAETEVLPRGSQGASQIMPSSGAEAGPTRKEMAGFPLMKEPGTERAGLGANAAYIDELRVRVQEAKRMREAAAAMTEFMVKDAHFMADAMRRERKTYSETVVPKSKLALETVRERYNTAAIPFIEYLDAARSYLNNSLELEKARKEHNRALVDLQDASGRSAAPLLAKPKDGGAP